MLDYFALAFVVAVKVFKKTTPNGKVTVYLGKRDFIDHMDYCDPVDGVVVVDTEYLKGRKVYSQVSSKSAVFSEIEIKVESEKHNFSLILLFVPV